MPLANAHAHNDYRNAKPLRDALAAGFTSVEADIHLINGKLYVSHGKPPNLEKAHTLEELYLAPLSDIANANDGNIYPKYTGNFFLMIDIKSNGEATFPILKEQLLKYVHMISQNTTDGKPVKVFISGNRPIKLILEDQSGIMSLDGRPDDVGKGFTKSAMPVVSENYEKFSPRNKQGKINAKNESIFSDFIKSVHAEGKLVRFWNAPDDPASWQYLLDHGVDLINTDDLTGLSQFLKNRPTN